MLSPSQSWHMWVPLIDDDEGMDLKCNSNTDRTNKPFISASVEDLVLVSHKSSQRPKWCQDRGREKKGFILIFSSLSERIFFGCSNPAFIFSIQPISCLPLFSGLVFAYSFFFFFNLYFSIKNSTQLRVCFLMGQVNVSGTHIFDFFFNFLWKYHCIYF